MKQTTDPKVTIMHIADIKKLPVVDIYDLDFEKVDYPGPYPSWYCATISEDDPRIEVVYDLSPDEDATVDLAVNIEENRHVYSSHSTADWPVLDHLFEGRENWQQFIAEKTQEERTRNE